jgi:hypothetical protein
MDISSQTPNAMASTVDVKLVYHGKVKIQTLDVNETFDSFMEKLKGLYGRDVNVEYVDEEGDCVEIIRTQDLSNAIELAKKQSSGKLRLLVTHVGPHPGHAPVPAPSAYPPPPPASALPALALPSPSNHVHPPNIPPPPIPILKVHGKKNS